MGKRHVLLDTRKIKVIDSSITQRFWPAEKVKEPVIVGDRPWEKWGPMVFGTIMHDQGRYRMWYNANAEVPPAGNAYYVAYAESSDGLHWEKPDLDIAPFGTASKTNVLNLIRHNPSVMRDDKEPDPAKRYKAAGFVGAKQVLKERGVAYPGDGFYRAYSPDGLHWTEHAPTARIGTINDVGNFIWDEPRQRYLATVKQMIRYDLVDRRSVAITTSQDFAHWSDPKTILVADALDDRIARERGYNHAEFYGMGLDPYDDFIVGLLWIYWVPLPFFPARRTGWWGHIDCQVVYSCEG